MDRYLPALSDRQRRWARLAAVLAILGVLTWVALILRDVLTPIVAALALAYVLNPLITMMERKYAVRRVTSVSVGLVLLILVGAALLFAGTVQVVQLAGNIPGYASQSFRWLDQTVPGLFTSAKPPAPADSTPESSRAPDTRPAGRSAADAEADERAATLAETRREKLMQLATEHGLAIGRSVVSYIADAVSNVFYWLSLTVLLPLYAFFFLLHFNEIVTTIRDHLPADYRPTIVRAVTTVDVAISDFFRGRVVICLIVGTLTGLGWLLLDVPYSLPLGALLAILNLVPFMSVLVLPPALLLTYFDTNSAGENWVIAVALVFAVYALAQGVESFVLTPTIQARSSGLHPVTTVIALLIGGQLAGLLGLLLAIPIASTLKSLGAEYVLPEVRRLAGQDGDAPGEPPPAGTEAAQPARPAPSRAADASVGDST